MGYTKQAITGISWLGGFRGVTRVLSFLRVAVVGRILTPSQFGLFSIATLVLSVIEILTETGINIFLVQQKEDMDKYINTAWIVSMIRGLIISIIIILFASYIAQFFGTRDAYPLILLISIVPFLRGFINPAIAKFSKDLLFHMEFYYRTSLFLVETVVTILLLLILHRPAALVFGLIVGALFEVIFSFFIVKPRPHFAFHRDLFQKVIHSGKWITTAGIFNYLYHNGDNIVVGRLLGSSSLGLYDIAYRISMLPISEVSDVINKVSFSIFVKMNDDKKRMRSAYLKVLIVVSVIVIPIGVIFYAFPELIIRILLGEKWFAAAPVLQILSIFGVIRAISFTGTSPLYADERQKAVSLITFVSVLGMGITVIPFIIWFGLVGAAYSALFGSAIALPVIFYELQKTFSSLR